MHESASREAIVAPDKGDEPQALGATSVRAMVEQRLVATVLTFFLVPALRPLHTNAAPSGAEVGNAPS